VDHDTKIMSKKFLLDKNILLDIITGRNHKQYIWMMLKTVSARNNDMKIITADYKIVAKYDTQADMVLVESK